MDKGIIVRGVSTSHLLQMPGLQDHDELIKTTMQIVQSPLNWISTAMNILTNIYNGRGINHLWCQYIVFIANTRTAKSKQINKKCNEKNENTAKLKFYGDAYALKHI